MPDAEKDAVHWGSVNARPTSLHGNGAASFDRTTLNWHAVTCRLCLSLRGSEDVPCPDKASSATHQNASVTRSGGSDA